MRFTAVLPSVECSHYGLKAFAPLMPSLVSHSKKHELDRTHSNSRNFNKTSRVHATRRPCKYANSHTDDILYGEPLFYIQGLTTGSGQEGEKNGGVHRKKKMHCATSRKSPFLDDNKHKSFPGARFNFLEPMMLGIKPKFPDWPDQETVIWATIEQKAKSLDIPLSLRMIKKKLQCEEGLNTDQNEDSSAHCSVKLAFASMVFIVVELQSYALQMREALCSEDMDVITTEVQKEMHSSFVWLFQQIFSKTPDLMLHVMILLANFSVCSASHNLASIDEIPPSLDKNTGSTSNILLLPESSKTHINDSSKSSRETSAYPPCDETELNLWSSMLDDAVKMRGDSNEYEVLDPEMMRSFVSPVSVEIEPDCYEDYFRTDLLYQMNLSIEPGNSLLLCNYAQFLHLVAKDYDRAEECFKRAVQATPPDADSLSQYGNFLWSVRKDYSGAEERFLQALACEPENSYYASKYASFLWSTGGEETCFPLNSSMQDDL